MNFFNLSNTLKNKFKTFISIGNAEHPVYSLPKNYVDVIHQQPLTKNNFNLIFKTVSENGGGDVWCNWALGLLNVAYPAFICTQNTSNKPITMDLFLQFLLPDQLIGHMARIQSIGEKSTFTKPITDLKNFMFNLPGFDKVLESREAAQMASQQLRYLVMQIESTIVGLSENDLWVDK